MSLLLIVSLGYAMVSEVVVMNYAKAKRDQNEASLSLSPKINFLPAS